MSGRVKAESADVRASSNVCFLFLNSDTFPIQGDSPGNAAEHQRNIRFVLRITRRLGYIHIYRSYLPCSHIYIFILIIYVYIYLLLLLYFVQHPSNKLTLLLTKIIQVCISSQIFSRSIGTPKNISHFSHTKLYVLLTHMTSVKGANNSGVDYIYHFFFYSRTVLLCLIKIK